MSICVSFTRFRVWFFLCSLRVYLAGWSLFFKVGCWWLFWLLSQYSFGLVGIFFSVGSSLYLIPNYAQKLIKMSVYQNISQKAVARFDLKGCGV